jgi:ribosomal protein L20
MGAAIAAFASIGTAAYGAYQNKKAGDANEQAQALSRQDYAERLKAAGIAAKELNDQYNEIVKDRPNLSWESFVGDKIKAINDPYLRQFYTNAKKEDFDRMREFAQTATTDNIENLQSAADKLSNGRWKEIITKRDDLVLNTDAASRMARTYELAAPVRTGASTVKYDSKGQLVEGQRADKQAFSVAQEVQTQIEQEQKQDLRQLENDRLNAAASQTAKASQFMQFFDATGYATAAESDRSNLVNGYQAIDEQRAFDIYKMFAGASAGIAPVQPTYQSEGAGNELISAGVKLGSQ